MMAGLDRLDRDQTLRSEVLEVAPGYILEHGIDGPWIERVTRHYGYAPRKVLGVFETKAKLVHFILSRHLTDAFEAVCVPGDWCGPPVDVLRSMSLALIAYESNQLERHRVFMAEYERGADTMRRILAQQLIYLTNNFQVALHAIRPKSRFKTLHTAADILLGQLMHAPLWWPKESAGRTSSTLLDAWVCTQIGLLAGIRRPAHRRPSAALLRLPELPAPEPPTYEVWRPEARKIEGDQPDCEALDDLSALGSHLVPA